MTFLNVHRKTISLLVLGIILLGLPVLILLLQKTQDIRQHASAPNSAGIPTWKVLFLIYKDTNVTFTVNGQTQTVQTSLSQTQIQDAEAITQTYKSLISQWSNNSVNVDVTIEHPTHPVSSVSSLGGSDYWYSYSNAKPDLDLYAPYGRYDSVFVIWRSSDGITSIPSYGWGLSVPPGSYANGAGYSTVTYPSNSTFYTAEANPGEIFVHEWNHQTTSYYQAKGYTMPDIDQAPRYGYSASSTTGWKSFLSDVMQGHVMSNGNLIGITPQIWQSGTPIYIPPPAISITPIPSEIVSPTAFITPTTFIGPTITGTGISVLNPNGAETMVAGSVSQIRWFIPNSLLTTVPAPFKTSLFLFKLVNGQRQAVKRLIVDSLSSVRGINTYSWTVDASPDQNYLVGVQLDDMANYYDFSDNTFSITAASPTVIQTPLPTATLSLTPTVIPTILPTPTLIPAKGTFSLSVILHGIGNNGDNTNKTGGNLTPKTPTRTAYVELINMGGTVLPAFLSQIIYQPTIQRFTGEARIPLTIPNGTYSVRIKSAGYLSSLIPGFITVTDNTMITLPVTSLTAGDTFVDNKLDILDFNMIMTCWITPELCSPEQKILSDLDDDGNVTATDDNLFIREITIQRGY